MNTFKATFLSLCISLPLILLGQDCRSYFPFEEGVKWEISNYNKKGKIQSKVNYEVLSVDNSAERTVGSFRMTTDAGGDEYTQEFTAECRAGELSIDLHTLAAYQYMEGMSGPDIKMESDLMIVPADPGVGDEFEDVGMVISMQAGFMEMKTSVQYEDRKIVGKETITTSAGTYDCLKLKYRSKAKVLMANFEFDVIEWFSKDVGMVRSEVYKADKDKLVSYQELTAYDK